MRKDIDTIFWHQKDKIYIMKINWKYSFELSL